MLPLSRIFTFIFPATLPLSEMTACFWGAFLFHLLFFLDPQAHSVSNLNRPCAEAQRVISLVVGGSVSCLSITGGLRTCHFCLVWVLQKIATSLHHLWLASSRLLVESSKFNSENLSPPPLASYSQLPANC